MLLTDMILKCLVGRWQVLHESTQAWGRDLLADTLLHISRQCPAHSPVYHQQQEPYKNKGSDHVAGVHLTPESQEPSESLRGT